VIPVLYIHDTCVTYDTLCYPCYPWYLCYPRYLCYPCYPVKPVLPLTPYDNYYSVLRVTHDTLCYPVIASYICYQVTCDTSVNHDTLWYILMLLMLPIWYPVIPVLPMLLVLPMISCVTHVTQWYLCHPWCPMLPCDNYLCYPFYSVIHTSVTHATCVTHNITINTHSDVMMMLHCKEKIHIWTTHYIADHERIEYYGQIDESLSIGSDALLRCKNMSWAWQHKGFCHRQLKEFRHSLINLSHNSAIEIFFITLLLKIRVLNDTLNVYYFIIKCNTIKLKHLARYLGIKTALNTNFVYSVNNKYYLCASVFVTMIITIFSINSTKKCFW